MKDDLVGIIFQYQNLDNNIYSCPIVFDFLYHSIMTDNLKVEVK